MIPNLLFAQENPESDIVYTDEDKAIFDDYMSKFLPLCRESIGDLVLQTGFYFLGTPYVSYTLEVTDTEKLIVNLRELDCTTFTENCIALARTVKCVCGDGRAAFETYLDELRKIRYRDGELGDYTSRLHYFSDWIYDNDRMGIVENMTDSLGGQPFTFYVDCMTRLRKSYKHLRENDAFCLVIDSLQKEISNRNYTYIPKAEIDSVDVCEGDIVAMTVNGKGLDIMHMGIAVEKFGKLYFMHASSVGKEVMITEFPFSEYAGNIKSNTGCMILRPKEPES